MKNTFGTSLSISIFGESHGEAVGLLLDGLAPGIPVDEDYIRAQLSLRRPAGRISTARQEPDPFRILSGVYEGHTTGTPVCIMIPNTQTRSKDYAATRFLARPGHADYTAWCKYHGFEDFRGGGHFSGRITAALVAGGAIALTALAQKGIRVGTHIRSCAGIRDRDFGDLAADIEALAHMPFAVLDAEAGARMLTRLEQIAEEGDSAGGVLETAVIGMPAGVGEPWFDTVEGLLSHALFSIPAVKGVQFGEGFDMADDLGSRFNDPFRLDGERIVTATNHNGGINGGITNGMPLLIRLAVKPTPSIYKTQDTVDLQTHEEAQLSIHGRHDPAIIHRARVVADSVTALVLYDLLAGRYGTDHFCKGEA
ncbi:MAG: chorismate synthase [Oscillospiraceae bacterium]|nr:chorismate synthase [Oscillospiraceae bacterium]